MGIIEFWLCFWMGVGIEGTFRPLERTAEAVTPWDWGREGIAAVDEPLW